jgi:hypothetical protein
VTALSSVLLAQLDFQDSMAFLELQEHLEPMVCQALEFQELTE